MVTDHRESLHKKDRLSNSARVVVVNAVPVNCYPLGSVDPDGLMAIPYPFIPPVVPGSNGQNPSRPDYPGIQGLPAYPGISIPDSLGDFNDDPLPTWTGMPLRESDSDSHVQNCNGYTPPPKSIPAFPDLNPAKPKTPVQGGGGLRKRWKDADGNIFEWDSQHGTLEKYNKRGKHQGEFSPETGVETKPKDKTRKVEP